MIFAFLPPRGIPMTSIPLQLRRAVSVCIGIPLLTLFAARHAEAASPKWDPVTPAELADNTPHVEAEAPAEVLNYRLDINEDTNGMREFLYRLRIKIYDPSRATDITRLARFWVGSGNANPFYEVFARLTLPDGSVRNFDEHDLRERKMESEGRANGLMGFLESGSNWGVEQKFLVVTGVETNWHMTSVQMSDIPIRRFEYTSRYTPGDEHFLRRFFLLNRYGGQMTNDEKNGIMAFSAENLPSIRREPLAPPDTYFSLTIIQAKEALYREMHPNHLSVRKPDPVPLSLGPWAYFSTREDFYDSDNGFVTKRVREKAAELVAGAADGRDKVRRIYSYVQSLYQRFRKRADLENWYTRYIDSVDELIDLDRIDSTIIREKDFHFLFIALVRAAGFECHTTQHPRRTVFPFSIEMVSEDFVDYVTIAVNIDGNWSLYDPTREVPLSAATLPWEIEGQPALMAMAQKQVFLNVPPSAAENSTAEVKADLKLDLEGNLAGECVRTFTGHFAQVARERLRENGREEWWQLARWLLDLENPSCEVRLLNVDGLENAEEPLRIHASVAWPAYASIMNTRIVFPIAVWQDGQAPFLNEQKRTTPVFDHFPKVETESITIHLPADFRPSFVPDPIKARSGDFSYSLSVTHDSANGLLKVERSATDRAIEIPVANYPKARDWFRRVGVADQFGLFLVHPAATQQK
jgi:transglutaminase-like putative cysteine protease